MNNVLGVDAEPSSWFVRTREFRAVREYEWGFVRVAGHQQDGIVPKHSATVKLFCCPEWVTQRGASCERSLH
jgi:hypothetical protein